MTTHSDDYSIHISEVLGAFASIKDPRRSNATRHVFEEMLFISISAMIAGAEGFTDFVSFAEAKREWLDGFLELPHGVPSHDAFGDLFALLDPEEFNLAFVEWTHELRVKCGREVVAVDGKSMRRSHDRGKGKAMVHTVSAWACKNRMVLGQLATEEKSNEITAIPKLLKMLDLEGCVVTIDAMGTQKEIVAEVVAKKADYVLALKRNHEVFYDEVRELMEDTETLQQLQRQGARLECFVETERGHGRVEKRSCVVLEKVDWFREGWQWEGLKSVIMVERHRKVGKEGEFTTERHFYISSLEANAEELARMIRSHWQVENSLHWVLDVVYDEDQCRVRKGHAASNLSMLRRWSLNLLKKAPVTGSVRIRQKRAAWDHDYLLKVLGF